MNQMEEALYRAGAHIVFKTIRETKTEALPPLNKMRVPVPKWSKKTISRNRDQRIIGGIPRDPVNRQSAIVTSKAPKSCGEIPRYRNDIPRTKNYANTTNTNRQAVRSFP